MTLQERLRGLMARKGLTQQQVGDAVGVTRQAVARWLAGLSEPKGKTLGKLASFLGCTAAWLQFGEGDSVQAFIEGEETPPDGVVEIREYQLRASCGCGAENDWEEIHNSRATWYRREFFDTRGVKPEQCRRITARGDSMEPFIFDGDHVLFAEEIEPVQIRDGHLYVLAIAGQLKIKRLASVKGGIEIRSDNPTYGTETYKGDELSQIKIFGRVLEISRAV